MIKKLAKFFWMAAFLIFSFCSFAESAEIQLVSGERLQGDVLSVGEGEMVLGCSWGEAEIKLEAVEEIYFVSREQKVSDKGLLLRDGTNLLGAQLAEKLGWGVQSTNTSRNTGGSRSCHKRDSLCRRKAFSGKT